MPTNFDARQSVLRPQLPILGNSANETLDNVLTTVDIELGKLFGNNNMLLDGSGILTFSGTELTFSSGTSLALDFSSILGGGPAIRCVIATSASVYSFNPGDMWYAIVNRSLGTVTANTTVLAATGLPALDAADLEVFLIAKMITDVSTSTNRLWFRNGWVIDAGSSLPIGGSASGFSVDSILTSNIDGTVIVDDITGDVLVDA